jgi:hypothetical protein
MRTCADIYTSVGIKYPSSIAAIISFYFDLNRGMELNSRNQNMDLFISKEDCLNKYFENPNFWNRVTLFAKKCYNRIQLYTIGQIGAFIAFQVYDKNQSIEVIESFLSQLFEETVDQYKCTRSLRQLICHDKLGKKLITIKKSIELLFRAYENYSLHSC